MITKKWTGKGSLLGHHFCDLLILDEASQMNLPEAMLAALPLRPGAPLIVVGDHRQMPPIVKHDWETEPRRTFREFAAYESLFTALRPLAGGLIQFEESFRLHRAMAEFLRQEIYRHDGIAYHSRRRDLLSPVGTEDSFVRAVLAPEHPLVVVTHDEADSQTRNPFEQALIAPILEALAGRLPELTADDREQLLGRLADRCAPRAGPHDVDRTHHGAVRPTPRPHQLRVSGALRGHAAQGRDQGLS